MRFLIVSGIAVFGQIIMIVVSSYIMITILQDKGIKDGMPSAGTIMIGVLFVIILLVVTGVQLFTMYPDKNK